MSKWRSSASLYSDVVRREFADERPLTIKRRFELYTIETRKRLERYVHSVVAPLYPNETRRLIDAGMSAVTYINRAPGDFMSQRNLARQMIYNWRRVLPDLPYQREKVFLTGLSEYVCGDHKPFRRLATGQVG